MGVEYETRVGRRILAYFDQSLIRVEHSSSGVVDWFGQLLVGKQLMEDLGQINVSCVVL